MEQKRSQEETRAEEGGAQGNSPQPRVGAVWAQVLITDVCDSYRPVHAQGHAPHNGSWATTMGHPYDDSLVRLKWS